MKILIINSDSPNNRGDRAILAGNIRLIKDTWPEADIWALSEFNKRDIEWYNINFLPMSAYSTSPFKLLQLVAFSRKCNYIFWGGGELLKDYTNKLGVLYWVFKITPIRIVNKYIYGMFQGIGPTKSFISKKMIVFLINKTRMFFVRDHESKEKLISWGVKTKVIASHDPAIVTEPHELDKNTIDILDSTFGINQDFLNNCTGIGVRKWFHYKESRWLPFRFRFWEQYQPKHNQELMDYTKNMAKLCDWIIEAYNTNLLFLPMHMSDSEDDASFSKDIIRHMQKQSCTKVVDQDILSPQKYHDLIGSCRVFIGIRLHSTILAATANVPSMVFYYVDKGRLFFEQLDMQYYCHPIEDLLKQTKVTELKQKISSLFENEEEIQHHLNQKITDMQETVYNDFRFGINR